MSVTKPSLPMTGGCSCGAIRYEITSFPLLLYTCNCTDCQTASGSAFALNMPVAAKGFRITKGVPKPWHHTSPMGVAVISWFCGDCGGRLYGDRAGREEIVNLRAGTLDDTRWLNPVAHMYLKSAPRLGEARGRRRMPRDRPDGFPPARGTMARDVAGVFRKKVTAPRSVRPPRVAGITFAQGDAPRQSRGASI
jgi:hypothetical protein